MEIMGLPLHPLVVHAVVVLVPLTALGGLGISVLRKLRTRYGTLVAAVGLVATVSTFVAQEAGKDFIATFARPTAAMLRHQSLGGGLLLWTILLFVGLVVQLVGDAMVQRQRAQGKIALAAGIVITVVTAVISIVQVIRIGHSGSTAVWGGG